MKRHSLLFGAMLVLTLPSCGDMPSVNRPTNSPTYTVTWINWNNNVLKIDRNVTEGSLPEYTGNVPVREEDDQYTYIWSGWSPSIHQVFEDITYKATFESQEKVINYTVTFITNGGSSIPQATVQKGHLLERPTDPSKTDYNFGGWYLDRELTQEYDFSQPVYSSFSLFAKWTITEYMVTFNVNYGNLPSVSYSTVDGFITYKPVRNGFSFNGWWLCDGFLSGQPILSRYFSFSTRVTSNDLVLYAEWVEEKMTSNQLDAPVITIDGDRVSWPEVPNATKYQIVILRNSSEQYNEQISNNVFTFPSSYDSGKYTIKVRSIGDGINYYNSSYVSKTYAHNILTSITNIAFNENNGILSWDEVINATEYELLLDNSTTLYSTISQYDFSALYAGSHTVKITATRSGWVSSSSTIKFTVHRLTAPINVTAILRETLDYDITWDEVKMSNGYANSYIIYLNDIQVSIVNSNRYILEHDSNYYIDGVLLFSVAAFDENSDYLISPKSESLSLIQKFEYKFDLIVLSEDSAKGVVEIISGSGYPGEEVTVNAIPTNDNAFGGWYCDDTRISNSATYSFTMPANDYTMVARFLTKEEAEAEEIKFGIKPIVSNNGNTITYGLYPQNHIDDPVLINSLNSLETPLLNDWYFYDGNYYAKIIASPYSNNPTFDNGTAIAKQTLYWFICKPIIWNVLENNNGEYFVLSNMLLDTCYYYHLDKIRTISNEKIYPNNYRFSDVNSFFLNDFRTFAFKLNDCYLKKSVTIDNSRSTTNSSHSENPYHSGEFKTTVFLLSYQDYLNSSFGFSTSTSDPEKTRICKITEWARAKGAYSRGDQHYGAYWTRSPYYRGSNYDDDDCVGIVSADCYLTWTTSWYSGYCVRPATTIVFD